jgi:hypothetical protein
MMSLDRGLREFVGVSNETPSLNPFLPHIYFPELANEFFSSPSVEDSHFIPPSRLDGNH